MNPKCPDSIDERPFEGMAIDDTSILDKLDGRSACTKCHKSRKYFCYTCYLPIEELQGLIPAVKLPIKVDVIKHRNEIDGKSTAIHGAILASEDVTIYTYPDIPDYSREKGVYLVYPSKQSVDISSLFTNSPAPKAKIYSKEEKTRGIHQGTLLTRRISDTNIQKKRNSKIYDLEGLPVKRAVFIDSTWNQSRGIYKDERIKQLPCVVIQDRISQFWRHQKGSPRWYLATVEAIHQFLLEVHMNAWGVSPAYRGPHCGEFWIMNDNTGSVQPYNGQYDNILFFFSHMYKKIHSLYEHEQLQAYKRPLS